MRQIPEQDTRNVQDEFRRLTRMIESTQKRPVGLVSIVLFDGGECATVMAGQVLSPFMVGMLNRTAMAVDKAIDINGGTLIDYSGQAAAAAKARN